jgi:ribokinase
MTKPKITVVGSNMVDLITYVDRMPERGETIAAPKFRMGFGGKGANQAVAAAMLGADVRMVTKVGDDMFGPNTIENLRRHGIQTDFVETVSGKSSGVAPIFVEPDSSNSILIIKGANEDLSPSDVDRAKSTIAESDIVIMQLEVRLETIYHTIELCRELNVPVLLNPAPADPRLDLEKIRTVDFFIPNETELKILTNMPVKTTDEITKAAGYLRDQGIKNIIVTMGERGALILDDSVARVIHPYKVASIDSTGAGDAFVGCFATYFVESGDLDVAISMANRYAALSTTRPGTQSSLFTRAEFEVEA